MQAHIYTLVILYVHGDRLNKMQRVSVGGFDAFKVGPNKVVRFPNGNALCELAGMIGRELPFRLLAGKAMDIDLDAVDGVIIRSPDCAEDQGIAIIRFQLLRWGSRNGQGLNAGSENGKQEKKRQKEENEPRG